MGARGSTTAQIILTDARVPADRLIGAQGHGFRIAMGALDSGRLGIAACAVGLAQAEFSALLQKGVPLARAPGLGMEYSNLGFALLGRIVGNVSGMRYQDYIRREIMVPLGMGSTGFDVMASPPERRAKVRRIIEEVMLHDPDRVLASDHNQR